MKVKIKKLDSNAIIPKYANDQDAGLDLTAVSKNFDHLGNIVYGTGLAIEIPEGNVGFIFPRSSISKTKQRLSNSVGVIDSGYRGEILLKFKPTMMYPGNEDTVQYSIGDRIGQLIIIPYPKIEFEEVDELNDTDRGNNGFGSTGVNDNK